MRVVEAGLVARLLQPVGVALAVAEAQRVGGHLRQLDAGEGCRRRTVQAAARARSARMWWPQCGQTFRFCSRSRVEHHLLAVGHWSQRLSGTSRRPEQGADLRADVFGEPAHAAHLRARARTPSARRAHLVEHARAPCPARRGPRASRLAASVSISAEPTTAASATRTASAACAGRAHAEADRDRQVGGARGCAAGRRPGSSAVALRVPVMPVMLT